MPRSWQLIQLRDHQSELDAPVVTFHRARLVCLDELAPDSHILCVPTDRILQTKSDALPLTGCALYVGLEPIHR